MLLFYEVLTRGQRAAHDQLSRPGRQRPKRFRPVRMSRRSNARFARRPSRIAARRGPSPAARGCVAAEPCRLADSSRRDGASRRWKPRPARRPVPRTLIASRPPIRSRPRCGITASRSRRDAFGPAEGLLGERRRSAPLGPPLRRRAPLEPQPVGTLRRLPLSVLPRRRARTRAARRAGARNRSSPPGHAGPSRARRVSSPAAGDARPADDALGTTTWNTSSAEFGNVLDALVRATPHSGVEAALVELDRRQIAKWAPRYHAEHGKYDGAWSELDAPLAPRTSSGVSARPARTKPTTKTRSPTSEPFVLDIERRADSDHRPDRPHRRRPVRRAATVFNVIDYKSGQRPSLSRDKIASGERLQPALYVMAAQASCSTTDEATPLWAGYWSMPTGSPSQARYSLHCSQDDRIAERALGGLAAEVVAQIGQIRPRDPRRRLPGRQPRRPMHEPLRIQHRLPHRPGPQPRQSTGSPTHADTLTPCPCRRRHSPTNRQQSLATRRDVSIALVRRGGLRQDVRPHRAVSVASGSDSDLVQEPAELRQLIAITFTDAAAREMRTPHPHKCYERLATGRTQRSQDALAQAAAGDRGGPREHDSRLLHGAVANPRRRGRPRSRRSACWIRPRPTCC